MVLLDLQTLEAEDHGAEAAKSAASKGCGPSHLSLIHC
jgi:hypothetical protein